MLLAWASLPAQGTNQGLSKYWQDKIANNQERDMRTNLALGKLGYKVITIWECQLGSETKRVRTLQSLVALLQDGGASDKAVCNNLPSFFRLG
jgi:G:T-mismatch repair DNA endonuclease (very short patch repair protein)